MKQQRWLPETSQKPQLSPRYPHLTILQFPLEEALSMDGNAWSLVSRWIGDHYFYVVWFLDQFIQLVGVLCVRLFYALGAPLIMPNKRPSQRLHFTMGVSREEISRQREQPVERP